MSEEIEFHFINNDRETDDNQIIGLLNETVTLADEYAVKEMKLAIQNQRDRDNAIAMRDVITHVPYSGSKSELAKLIIDANLLKRSWIDNLDENKNLVVTGGSILVTATTAVSTSLPSLADPSYYLPANVSQVVDPIRLFNDRISGIERKDEVIDLLKDWGLDKGFFQNKAPLDFFITAHAAFEIRIGNTDPTPASLLPMRSCIQSTLGRLKRLRPDRSNAKGVSDIILIGEQLRSDLIDMSIVETWEKEWNEIKPKLDDSKFNEIDRDEWKRRLYEATIFVHALLGGLDIRKARKFNH